VKLHSSLAKGPREPIGRRRSLFYEPPQASALQHWGWEVVIAGGLMSMDFTNSYF